MRFDLGVFALALMCLIGSACERHAPQVALTYPTISEWNAYVGCAPIEAVYILAFAVRDSHGNKHEETFPLRIEKIACYPMHVGGFGSGDGGGGGFNRSCFIETGTDTSVAVRFKLKSTPTDGESLNLDELIWATAGLDTTVVLSENATATLEFHKPGSR